MTIKETIKNILDSSVSHGRNPDYYYVEKCGHLLENECKDWAHIGKYIDAWSADDKLVIEWYGIHLVFVSQ